jgi:hypothetical protein
VYKIYQIEEDGTLVVPYKLDTTRRDTGSKVVKIPVISANSFKNFQDAETEIAENHDLLGRFVILKVYIK